jgi:hypothetical protein
VLGISQDSKDQTVELLERMGLTLPTAIDKDLRLTRMFDPLAVPTLYLIDGEGKILFEQAGFDKTGLNRISQMLARELGQPGISIAPPFDGAPERKPGCASRHLEPDADAVDASAAPIYSGAHPQRVERASRITLPDGADPYEYCMEAFGDPLPVIPPTQERVESMFASVALPPDRVIGLIPPNYGAATVEKIAANAVMAGCLPEMMPVLLTAVRAAVDERFNLHGIQATTHFAAPLLIINGPIRDEMKFGYRGNVFSNVARANSSLGRAFQLILTNLGGARPGEIDMSTLGNPGKFSSCIAENEEASPWEPLHVEMGFHADESALTLFGADPPRGVSEHQARAGGQILRAISHTLATVWSYRMCGATEALVVFCPEHVRTLDRDGFTKEDVRDLLFRNTGIPLSEYEHGGEGTQMLKAFTEIEIDGRRCYQKFREPGAIKIIVAGGTAGKFSAVMGGWASGARGSQMVTYPIERQPREG